MAKTATIQTRVDPTVKHNAQIILKKLNISMSEAIARIHNGGPMGWRKESTKPYWEKVKKAMGY